MKILLVAATFAEIAPFAEQYGLISGEEVRIGIFQLKILVSGAGMVATAYALGKEIALQQPDLIINAGIAGAISDAINIGDLVHITSEHQYGFGAENQGDFLSASALGLIQTSDEELYARPVPVAFTALVSAVSQLKSGKGITVQTVHGNTDSIQQLNKNVAGALVESMEGAAVFYAAHQAGIPVVEVRCISNRVEPRNRSSWDIPTAIARLNDFLLQVFASNSSESSKTF